MHAAAAAVASFLSWEGQMKQRIRQVGSELPKLQRASRRISCNVKSQEMRCFVLKYSQKAVLVSHFAHGRQGKAPKAIICTKCFFADRKGTANVRRIQELPRDSKQQS